MIKCTLFALSLQVSLYAQGPLNPCIAIGPVPGYIICNNTSGPHPVYQGPLVVFITQQRLNIANINPQVIELVGNPMGASWMIWKNGVAMNPVSTGGSEVPDYTFTYSAAPNKIQFMYYIMFNKNTQKLKVNDVIVAW